MHAWSGPSVWNKPIELQNGQLRDAPVNLRHDLMVISQQAKGYIDLKASGSFWTCVAIVTATNPLSDFLHSRLGQTHNSCGLRLSFSGTCRSLVKHTFEDLCLVYDRRQSLNSIEVPTVTATTSRSPLPLTRLISVNLLQLVPRNLLFQTQVWKWLW